MRLTYDKHAKKYQLLDFVPDHNHMLYTPETVHLMSSQQNMSDVQALEIDLADNLGIKTKTSYELIMSRRGGGKSSVGYTLTDQKNYLRKRRQRN